MNKFEELKAKVASLEVDAQRFYDADNKAAGTRLRVGLQECKVLAQEARGQVTELKNKLVEKQSW